MKKGQFVLTGIAILLPSRHIALFRDVLTSKTARAEEGKEEIRGMQVEKIERNKATLRLGRSGRSLPFTERKSPFAPPVHNPTSVGGSFSPDSGQMPHSSPQQAFLSKATAEDLQRIDDKRAVRVLPPLSPK